MYFEIKNLEELIEDYVGPTKKLVSSEIKNLTAPGENYLSVMLQVDLQLKDEDTGREEKLHAVGKCVLSSNVHHFLQDISRKNYKRELVFYTVIIPTLKNFIKDKGFSANFDLFPALIAHRANLHGRSDEADENSVLLMENMKTSGKQNSCSFI